MATGLKFGGTSFSLDKIPTEIFDVIASYLPQEDLLTLMITNRAMKEIATFFLYDAPIFASSYRFAQFTYLISYNPDLALKVRSLDLSNICSDPRDVPDERGQFQPLAGWPEFTLRHMALYPVEIKPRIPERIRDQIRDGISNKNKKQNTIRRQNPLVNFETLRSLDKSKTKSSHPPASQWHSNYHRNRNIPIGGLCHVFAACRRLKKVNLSGLSIITDELILSREITKTNPRLERGQFVTRFPTSHNPTSPPFKTGIPGSPSTHPWFIPDEPPKYNIESSEPPPKILKAAPNSCPSPLHVFSSDMQHDRWCERPAETVYVNGDEVISWLCTLPELEELSMKGVEWFAGYRVKKLVRDLVRPKVGKSKGIQFLDFRDSGCGQHLKERRKDMVGKREDVERLVVGMRASGMEI